MEDQKTRQLAEKKKAETKVNAGMNNFKFLTVLTTLFENIVNSLKNYQTIIIQLQIHFLRIEQPKS